ncbi:preprotein translocase subunit YajC [Algicola sagamiensis]|uniref:preprotein translocase subunit YajC n=1 Tax=Algicola sagamiensis TaxID=163869 RepID=UPI00036B14A3|nr:preprotein translocase subunit YajC [Algicola sagamiensis]
MSLFISNAYADGGAPAQAGGGFEMLIMLAIFGVFFYFVVYRPQAKRVKEHKELMSALSKGDEVLTAGGLVGKIVKVTEENDFIRVSLNDNSEVMVQKASISAVLPKGTIKSL